MGLGGGSEGRDRHFEGARKVRPYPTGRLMGATGRQILPERFGLRRSCEMRLRSWSEKIFLPVAKQELAKGGVRAGAAFAMGRMLSLCVS